MLELSLSVFMSGSWSRQFLLTLTLLCGVRDVGAALNTLRAMECEKPPKIDGKLDEEVWLRADSAGGLTQIEPKLGQPASETTQVRIIYDQAAIYVGVTCRDRNPAGILARGRERDGSVLSGDHVALFFDTFNDSRNGYIFAISPDEGRWDALVSNHSNANTNWDGLWEVKAVTGKSGWTAELKIPFKSITYSPDSQVWGFNFSRTIARRGENVRWNSPRPEAQVHFAGDAGKLTGLRNLPENLGIEAAPYFLGRSRKVKGSDRSNELDAGLDIRWRINSGLSATLSFNTDFAETEVDQRQINFTRFPLFFPEKRDFFLEDAGIYRFADLNQSLLTPYFSRKIGLSASGQPVPIEAAGKVAGRIGKYELGVTAAMLEEANGVDSTPVFAGRISRQIFGESTAGLIATTGDPRSNGDNAMLGVDFRFQTSKWLGDQTLITNLFYLNSWTDPMDAPEFSGHAFGLGLEWPGDKFSVSLQAAEIEPGFDPALGFIRRNDVRYYSSNWRYLMRPEKPTWFQWSSFIYANQIYTDLDNEPLTTSHSFFPLVVRFSQNDELSFGITHTSDLIQFPYTIPGDINIPAANYEDMVTYEVKWKLNEARSLSGEFGSRWGDYYGGDWHSAFANLWYIPGSLTACGVSYDFNHFDLPDGEVDSHLLSLWLVLRFTPNVRWSNLVQYDTISETIGFNSRFSWEYKLGHRLNLVLSQLYYDDSTGFQVLDTEMVAKVGMRIRF